METTAQSDRKSATQCHTVHEELKVTGEELLKTIRELVRQGNCRRIVIRNEHGHTLVELPVVLALAGGLLAPVWAAIGAMAAIVGGFSLIVERDVDGGETPHA